MSQPKQKRISPAQYRTHRNRFYVLMPLGFLIGLSLFSYVMTTLLQAVYAVGMVDFTALLQQINVFNAIQTSLTALFLVWWTHILQRYWDEFQRLTTEQEQTTQEQQRIARLTTRSSSASENTTPATHPTPRRRRYRHRRR